MRHVSMQALAGAIETRGEEDDTVALVTKALDDFKTSVDDRLKAVEAKADTGKLVERLDKLEAKANRPGDDKAKTEPTEERKSFGTYLRLGPAAGEEERKALTVSSDPQGGYLAPAEFSTEFIRDLVEVSPVRSIVSARSTSAPAVNYPARTGIGGNARWVGEIEQRPKSEPTFGQLEILVHELATYVDISNQLLTDSGGSAETEVRLALAEDFGLKETSAFVNGTGVKQPQGFMAADGVGFVANGHVSNLSADALITAMYSLPATYRNRGSWVMNGTTIAAIRKLKDGQGNYLWQPSYQAGQPETILGRPVVDVLDMPDVAADAFPIAFGDFASAYRIVDRLAMSVLVNPYILATEGQTRIHATRRVGGGVIRPKAITKLKMSVN